MNQFEAKKGFSGVIGAIDGMKQNLGSDSQVQIQIQVQIHFQIHIHLTIFWPP